MSETKRNVKRKYLRYAAIVLLVVFCLSVFLLVLNVWENSQSEYDGDEVFLSATLEYEGKDYTLRDDVEVVLLLGLDKYNEAADNTGYNNDRQADFLLLLVFDNTQKTCTGLQINRDTMAEMNVLGVAGDKIGTVNQQITLAHTYGNGREVSCRNTVDSISKLLKGVKVDHYVSVTMDAVPVYNDLVGGVTLTVLEDFTDIDDTLIKGEEITLMGEHALNYVRGRYGVADGTNAKRMERQRQYLTALYDKTRLSIENDDNFTLNAVTKVSDYVVSDCTVNQMQTILEKFSTYEFKEIRELEGEYIVGEKYMEFYPNEASIMKTVVELFYELD